MCWPGMCMEGKNYKKKVLPIAAFVYENAAIDLRLSVVETKGGDLWLRFRKKRSQNRAYSCVFYENAAIDLHLSFALHFA